MLSVQGVLLDVTHDGGYKYFDGAVTTKGAAMKASSLYHKTYSMVHSMCATYEMFPLMSAPL